MQRWIYIYCVILPCWLEPLKHEPEQSQLLKKLTYIHESQLWGIFLDRNRKPWCPVQSQRSKWGKSNERRDERLITWSLPHISSFRSGLQFTDWGVAKGLRFICFVFEDCQEYNLVSFWPAIPCSPAVILAGRGQAHTDWEVAEVGRMLFEGDQLSWDLSQALKRSPTDQRAQERLNY